MRVRCPTCTAPLGTNEVIEPFPVGRRVAFDVGRGRFWVICGRCRSWNLAPLEERWEAVDTAARLFERAVIGGSTGSIALGRVAEGTELVRVGGGAEAELAGWRYGRQLVGRWRRHRRLAAASLGVAGALTLAPAVGPGVVVALYAGLGGAGIALRRVRSNRPIFFRRSGPAAGLYRERDVQRLLLAPAPGDEGWRLLLDRWYRPPLALEPREAGRSLRAMLRVWNAAGGSPRQVRRATARVVELGSPDRVLARVARDLNEGRAWEHHLAWPFRETARIQWADPTLRLALEIAAHEELERRALEGELRILEREWEAAEELAAIADGLLVAGPVPDPH